MRFFDKGISRLENFAAIGAMAIMTFSIFLQILFRYVIQDALPWTEELARYAMIYLTFFGVSAAFRDNKHIMITLAIDPLPYRVERIITLVASLIILAANIYFTYSAIQFCQRIFITGQTTPAIRIPMWIINLAMSIGFFFSTIREGQIVVRVIKDIIRGEALPKENKEEAAVAVAKEEVGK